MPSKQPGRGRGWLLGGLLGLLATGAARAQDTPNDHLEPPRSSFTELPSNSLYYALLRQRLALDSARTAWVLVVVMPSFTPEYALSIESAETDFWLTSRVAQRNIGQSAAQPQPGGLITRRRVRLTPALAQGLQDVLTAALAQTRYPLGQPIRFDGTDYFVATTIPNLGTRSGETWSPPAHSRMGDLVELLTGMLELTTKPDHPKFSQDVLLTEARQLLVRLAAR